MPEAAFVAGVSVRRVQREVDEGVVEARTRDGRRSISGLDVFYLHALRAYSAAMAPGLRRAVRNAIVHSAGRGLPMAELAPFMLSISDLEAALSQGYATLERTKHDLIESRPDVLAGAPVLRGTRLGARFVAELVRQGATPAELLDDFDLTAEQVAAAVLFDRVTPRRGRPRKPSTAEPGGARPETRGR